MKNYVAYYRVSTQMQGIDGLGIQSQQSAVSNYVNNNGVIIATFSEVETSTNKKKRIEIYKAIEYAKLHKATLVVAKLDRLARDVSFTTALYNGNVDFVCCDNPNANKLTIQLLSVIAENEAEMIALRTKETLAIKKQNILKGIYTNKDGSTMKPDVNGVYRLGNPNGFCGVQSKGVEAIKANALSNKANIQATDIIVSARKDNQTYQQITDKLNTLGYTTRYGKAFNPIQVHRLYNKAISITSGILI
jgi:DNA invertase Pin-like site-specific DNA recombinase